MISRRLFPAAGFALATCLFAADKVDPVYQEKGAAIRGFDPVAYFTDSKAVKGDPQFTYKFQGGTWQFASAAHRDLFAQDPVKYAPQFGGYCSYAVSENYTAEIDPEAWRIVEGKLYLNYSKKIQEKWAQDLDRRIVAAGKNWPALHK